MSKTKTTQTPLAPPRRFSGGRGVGARAFQRQARGRRKQTTSRRAEVHAARLWPAIRRALRRAPTAAWLCALVGCCNAVAWSLITPPFQIPDEPEHVAYVKQLAETGKLPSASGNFSVEERFELQDTKLQLVAEEPEFKPISSKAEQEKLQSDLRRAEQSSELGSEYAGVAASQPPLYYVLQSFPYTLARSGTLLDRIATMRLLSALFGGLTALFTFLFLRETLPRVRWAWTVGALGVALVPLLGFMSGSVNPDSMLYAVSAALFFALARGFRLGLTRRRAIVLGAVIAVGFATKLNFIGLAPGALLGLVLLSVRAARTLGRRAYVSLAIALAVAFLPPAAYMIAHIANGSPAFGIVSSAISIGHGSVFKELSYIWQLYLPRLPWMHSYFGGLSTSKFWFRGYVGLYGWLDTTFPAWVYEFALIPTALIAVLAMRTLIAGARALRARVAELSVYGAMALGLMALVGADSYLTLPRVATEYAQGRYLVPLVPLLGVVLALAARGGGKRWGPVVGAIIIVLFLGHDIFSQLQEVARFYD